MTDSFGVMDFSTLKKENDTNGTSEPIRGEVAVREDNLESLIQESQNQLTFMLVTSARVNGGAAFVDDIRTALSRYAGTIRFALLDADQQPRVAAAMRVQNLPAAMVLIKGQLQPLFEGVVKAEQLAPVLDNLVQIAQQEGMYTEEVAPEQQAPAFPPELEAAFGSMENGDFAAAREAFSAYLDKHPGDAEGKKGLAMVDLLERTAGIDLYKGREAAANDPKDIDAQLLGADLDLLGGHVDDAFARLLTTFRDADAESRTAVRERLLALFDVVGPDDPRVSAARKKLSRLMF